MYTKFIKLFVFLILGISCSFAQLPKLQVVGNQIQDSCGRKIILRGVSIKEPNIEIAKLVVSQDDPIEGGNIVYSAHIYPNHWVDTSYINVMKNVELCAVKHPVMITEWGFGQNAQTLWGGTAEKEGFEPLFHTNFRIHSVNIQKNKDLNSYNFHINLN